MINDSSATEERTSPGDSAAGEIARWSTQVGGVTVNFAFGHVRDLQKESRMMQKAPAVSPDKGQDQIVADEQEGDS